MKNPFSKILVLAFLSSIALSSCQMNKKEDNSESEQKTEVITTEKKLILLSKRYPNNAFMNWIARYAPNFDFVEANQIDPDSAASILSRVDGILLTGGEDISPTLYGLTDSEGLCGEIDLYRDSLELFLVNYALDNELPLLGVCRGMQMINVALGGTLILDIPSQRGSDIHQTEGVDATHVVSFVQDDYNPYKWPNEEVNSNHHQAIDQLGKPLVITAYAPDSLPEAIVILDTVDHPFVLGVQWHPERMESGKTLSDRPAIEFIKAIVK